MVHIIYGPYNMAHRQVSVIKSMIPAQGALDKGHVQIEILIQLIELALLNYDIIKLIIYILII